eukprot:4129568-Heterocapsa_arctica.AAC.1
MCTGPAPISSPDGGTTRAVAGACLLSAKISTLSCSMRSTFARSEISIPSRISSARRRYSVLIVKISSARESLALGGVL